MMTDSELDTLLEAFKAKNRFLLDGDHAVRQPPMKAQRLEEIESDYAITEPEYADFNTFIAEVALRARLCTTIAGNQTVNGSRRSRRI